MADLVAAFAEPTRRRLLALLSSGEQTVSGLAAHFGVTRSAISQHLAVLAEAGLVQVRQEGRWRYYRLDPAGMRALREALDMFWTNELEQLVAVRPTIKGATPMTADPTTTVEHSVIVPLGPDETFAMLTEPERLRRWQAVTARVDLRAGGEYRWTIVPGLSAAGTFSEIEPGKRLVFTWGWEGDESLPPGASTVTITLEPAEGGTLVRLVHDGLTSEQAAGHSEGWKHYWERLASASIDGEAGADEWVTRVDSLDALGAAEAALAACQLVLRGVPAEAGSARTPCSKFAVDDLLDHLMGSVTHLGAVAGGEIPDNKAGSREVRLADAAQVALEAWGRRGLDGEVNLGQNAAPATVPVGILGIEFLVHAWDFAQATGQEVIAGDALVEFVDQFARQIVRPEMRDGDRFAAEVELGPDASHLERLVAFTGRGRGSSAAV
ncbi:MAG: TIGR03086 family metal-binding protein [Acidimicrobiales bacterium]|jgi:uncharacterized protein (TIGR03086 family)